MRNTCTATSKKKLIDILRNIFYVLGLISASSFSSSTLLAVFHHKCICLYSMYKTLIARCLIQVFNSKNHRINTSAINWYMGESFNYHCEYFWQSDIIRNELGKHLGPFIKMFDISCNLILTQIKIVDFIQLILSCHSTSALLTSTDTSYIIYICQFCNTMLWLGNSLVNASKKHA